MIIFVRIRTRAWYTTGAWKCIE